MPTVETNGFLLLTHCKNWLHEETYDLKLQGNDPEIEDLHCRPE